MIILIAADAIKLIVASPVFCAPRRSEREEFNLSQAFSDIFNIWPI
jgi:hypothetical protein